MSGSLRDWDAHHVADTGLASGCCYDPDPNLPQANGRTADVYFAAEHSDGRVLNYQMRFQQGTIITVAKLRLLREFPADARVVWYRVLGNDCAQMEVPSQTLAGALGGVVGDPQGMAFNKLGTAYNDGTERYDASNINEAMLELGSCPTTADAPAC